MLTPKIVASLAPLSALGEESLTQVISLAHVESFSRSSTSLPFHWDHKVAYLLKGELKVDYANGSMKVLVGGHAAAAMPVGRGGNVPVSARAITDVTLVWFDENALDILVTWDQLVPGAAARETAESATDRRTMTGIFDARKLTMGTFASLPAANIDSLLACFERRMARADEVIIQQGGPGDFYYVIERGRARVTREVAGASIELAELKSGDAFGEEALIAETSRNASVTMLTDGELLRLDGADFIRLLREPLLQRLAPDEAWRRAGHGAVWLDVRFAAEFQHDGLPGAINIPLNELRDAVSCLKRDVEYIVYCQTGRRSSAAAFLLSQRGLRASLLDGGLKSIPALEKAA